ncbi:MAG: hypothetical protein AAF242_21215, partial [Bacteroidota bacterium]
QIKAGYRADLLLLDENPIEDISNTTSIAGVIKNGQWFTNDEMQIELNKLSAHYEKLAPIVLKIENLVSQGEVKAAYEIHDKAKQSYPTDPFLGYYVMGYRGYQFLYQNRRLTTDSLQAEKAALFYEMYARDYPDMHGSYYFQGLSAKAQKDTSKAIGYFNKSLSLHPSNPYALRHLKSFD